jgi:hypothetical protein
LDIRRDYAIWLEELYDDVLELIVSHSMLLLTAAIRD